MAAAVLRGGVGASTAAPSMRCSCSTASAGGGPFASESGYSHVGSRAVPVISRVRLSPSAGPSSFSSSYPPPFMGAAGTRFGPVFRALRRSSSLQMQQLARKGPSPSPSRTGSAVIRSVWKQEVLWANSPVAEVEKAAESLFHVVLDISDNPELIEGHTAPGQFVQVKVGNTKPAFLAIASPPNVARKGRLEFLIKDPGVEGSTAGILCSLGKGDKVELSQVMGNGFKVEELEPADENQTVLLFATGSGISPIRSLMEAGFGADKRTDVRLYYGARNLDRMAYQEKFKDWEASGVQIVPVLSQPGPDWNGAQGYVQAFFSKNKGIANGAQTGALLCGHKGMAQDVTELLLAEGVPKEKILLNF
ncbi:unnamed protein product [Calypogeia fissa]